MRKTILTIALVGICLVGGCDDRHGHVLTDKGVKALDSLVANDSIREARIIELEKSVRILQAHDDINLVIIDSLWVKVYSDTVGANALRCKLYHQLLTGSKK